MQLRDHWRQIQIVATLIFIGVAFAAVPFHEVRAAFYRAELWAVTLTFLLMPFAVIARALRWRFIVAEQDILITRFESTKICLIGHAYNLFLPASLGDIVRSYYGWQVYGNKEVMLSASIIDKVIALFTLCVLGLLCSLSLGNLELLIVTTIVALPLGVLVFLPGIVPWALASSLFRRLLNVEFDVGLLMQAFRLSNSAILKTIAYSIVGWILTNLMYFFAWRAFTPDVSVIYAFAIAPLINLMRVVPITVSGIGSVELLVVFLFSMAGMRESDALMGSLVVTVALIILPGLFGCVPLISSLRSSSPSTNSDSS